MRRLMGRGLRLELVAGLALALAVPALAASGSQALATQTTLTAETHDRAGHTQISLAVSVTGEDGLPATGAVAIKDHGKPLAGLALDAEGHARTVLSLIGGSHLLTAAYTGDATHGSSVSPASSTQTQTGGVPDFQIAVAPSTLSVTSGSTGTVIVSVTPENSSSLSAPMFLTLSCSGLPDQAFCNFSPLNIEILPNTTTAVTSTMTLLTQNVSGSQSSLRPGAGPSSVAWAFLLPGALVLGGIAWGNRRRAWLSRVSLVALVGLVSTLGMTACNPRYNYLHHGPDPNPSTPAGNYTINVTAQSSDGITAITHSTPLALTVK